MITAACTPETKPPVPLPRDFSTQVEVGAGSDMDPNIVMTTPGPKHIDLSGPELRPAIASRCPYPVAGLKVDSAIPVGTVTPGETAAFADRVRESVLGEVGQHYDFYAIDDHVGPSHPEDAAQLQPTGSPWVIAEKPILTGTAFVAAQCLEPRTDFTRKQRKGR